MDRAAETIFALSSGAPPAAISVVRLSGPDSKIVASALTGKSEFTPRFATLCKLHNQNGDLIDSAVCVFFEGPSSYTGQDMFEISIHGSRHILDVLFMALEAQGCRPADPGEFTRRAFENGKLDLTQAEAVADLIDAETEAQHRQALDQLDGGLSRLYQGWRSDLVSILALLEAAIDFPDEDDAPDSFAPAVLPQLNELILSLEAALSGGGAGEKIRDGFRVVLLGPPNAGKSTLLNRLAGREAAIVTDIPGTTRDVVEVRLKIGAYLVWLSDTAGLRATTDPIEKEGVRRAQAAAASADLRILVRDGTGTGSAGDELLDADIMVENKADLREAFTTSVSRETLSISAKTGLGVDRLLGEIESRLDEIARPQIAPQLTRARHRRALGLAHMALVNAKTTLSAGYGAEMVAEDVRIAAYEMASLTGEVDVEEILGAVFSAFCIGK